MSGFYPVLISISLGIQRVLLTVSAAESVYQKSLVVVLLTDFYLTTCDKRCQLQVSYNNDIRVLKFMKSTIFQLPVCLFSFLAELHNVYLLSGERFTQLKPFHLLYPFRWSGHREQKWLLSEALRKQFFTPLIQVIGWVASNWKIAKISGIATERTLQVARRKYVAEGFSRRPKNHFGERSMLFRHSSIINR